MKVAYISVYRDNTGYGDAAINCIEALDSVGVNVLPIWVTLSGNPSYHPGDRIAELEKNTQGKIDVVIQHITPNLFCRKEGVKNIGLFFWETTSFRGSSWANSCNLMDEIWVTTKEQKEACLNSGVNVLVKIIDLPRSVSKYSKDVPSLSLDPFIDSTFKFYTVGDVSYRKNTFGLIHTFLTEFSSSDNVSLILKTYLSGKTYNESKAYLKSVINEIKANAKKPDWSFPKILIANRRLEEEEMLSLHKTCNCFVTSSRGEGDCLPAVDAAMVGNPVVGANWNGIRENFINTKHPLVQTLYEKPVVGMKDQPNRYYNSDETWMEPCQLEMAGHMRDVYENYSSYHEQAKKDSEEMSRKFDYRVEVNSLSMSSFALAISSLVKGLNHKQVYRLHQYM